MAIMHVYSWAGAPAWLVAAGVGIFGTHVGVRTIRARVLARPSRLLSLYDTLVLAPAAMRLALGPSVSIEWMAIIATATIAVRLSLSFWRTLVEPRALDASGRTLRSP